MKIEMVLLTLVFAAATAAEIRTRDDAINDVIDLESIKQQNFGPMQSTELSQNPNVEGVKIIDRYRVSCLPFCMRMLIGLKMVFTSKGCNHYRGYIKKDCNACRQRGCHHPHLYVFHVRPTTY